MNYNDFIRFLNRMMRNLMSSCERPSLDDVWFTRARPPKKKLWKQPFRGGMKKAPGRFMQNRKRKIAAARAASGATGSGPRRGKSAALAKKSMAAKSRMADREENLKKRKAPEISIAGRASEPEPRQERLKDARLGRTWVSCSFRDGSKAPSFTSIGSKETSTEKGH